MTDTQLKFMCPGTTQRRFRGRHIWPAWSLTAMSSCTWVAPVAWEEQLERARDAQVIINTRRADPLTW